MALLPLVTGSSGVGWSASEGNTHKDECAYVHTHASTQVLYVHTDAHAPNFTVYSVRNKHFNSPYVKD